MSTMSHNTISNTIYILYSEILKSVTSYTFHKHYYFKNIIDLAIVTYRKLNSLSTIILASESSDEKQIHKVLVIKYLFICDVNIIFSTICAAKKFSSC